MAILVSGPSKAGSKGGKGRVITTPVQTAQVAPTIVSILGADPNDLQAVQQEQTAVLPGIKIK